MKNIINDFKVKKIYLKKYYGLDGTTSSGYDSNEEYIANEFKNYKNILLIPQVHKFLNLA